MFGGSQVLFLCAIFGMGHALELRGTQEGSCRAIQNIPTMDVDPIWLDSLHYMNAGNQFHLYRQSSVHPRFSEMREDEFYYRGCFTKNTSLIEGNGSVFGFGGHVLGSFDVEPSRDPHAVVDAYPNNPQTGRRSDFFRQKVSLTDYRTFALMVHCWVGADQKSWNVYSLTPELDKSTERLISDHIQALGFDKDKFVFVRYANCKGLEGSGGSRNASAGGNRQHVEASGNKQGISSNHSGKDQGGNLSRLNPKDQQQRPAIDIPGLDTDILKPKVRGVGLPTVSNRGRNHIEDDNRWSQPGKETGSSNNSQGGRRNSGSHDDDDDDGQNQRTDYSKDGSSQSGNRLGRLQSGKEHLDNRETGGNMGGQQQRRLTRLGGTGGSGQHPGSNSDQSGSIKRGIPFGGATTLRSPGRVERKEQPRSDNHNDQTGSIIRGIPSGGPPTLKNAVGVERREQRPGSNSDQSGSIKRGIPSGGATTLKNAGGILTTPAPTRGSKPTRTNIVTTTKAPQRTTSHPKRSDDDHGDGSEGHGWTAP